MKTEISVFELLITVLFLVLGIGILIDDRMFALEAYIGFFNKWYLVTGMFSLAAISTYCLTRHESGSRFCAGIVMLLAALGWAIISSQFFKAYPPLTFEMIFFPTLTAFCFMVGFKNIFKSRTIENAELIDH